MAEAGLTPERLEKLLEATLHTALAMKAVRPQEFQQVNVDTTVQEKAIAFSDRRGCITRCGWPWSGGPNPWASCCGRAIVFKAKGCWPNKVAADARQMKRAAKMTRQLQTILGRVVRDIEPQGRQIAGPNRGWAARRADRFGRAFARSNAHQQNKLYSVHAPEVECICKGKVHKRYEFGCKTSVATTSKSNWIVGTQALHGNPYDGHTLDSAIGQVERLTGRTPNDVMVDQGYRGHGYAGSAVIHVVRTIPKQATRALKRMLRRRAAIEPTIGHLKSDNRMNRNYLTGREGDKINAVLSAAGYNLRKLLRWVVFAPTFWLRWWMTAVVIGHRRVPSWTVGVQFTPAST